jgi:hypothetical protein
MQPKDDAHWPLVLADRFEDLKIGAVDIDAALHTLPADQELGGGMRRLGKLIGMQHPARIARQHRSDDLRRLCGLRAGQIVVRAVQPGFDLGAEQIDRTGDAEEDDEGDGEQAGVEMPAPDHAVIQKGPPRPACGCGRCRDGHDTPFSEADTHASRHVEG